MSSVPPSTMADSRQQLEDLHRRILELVGDDADRLAQAVQDYRDILAAFDTERQLRTALELDEDELNRPVSELGLSARVVNALNRERIYTLGQLLLHDELAVGDIRNLGAGSRASIKAVLRTIGEQGTRLMPVIREGVVLPDGMRWIELPRYNGVRVPSGLIGIVPLSALVDDAGPTAAAMLLMASLLERHIPGCTVAQAAGLQPGQVRDQCDWSALPDPPQAHITKEQYALRLLMALMMQYGIDWPRHII